MFTTQTFFLSLFTPIPIGWTPPKPKPKFVPPKPKPKQFSLYSYDIEDYHTHF